MSYLSIYRGDDRALLITSSVDLTGSEVWFTVKRKRQDADVDAVIAKSTDQGDITVAGFQATVTIDAADTQDLDPVALYWDVQIVDGDGKVRTVATGRLAVLADITREAPAS